MSKQNVMSYRGHAARVEYDGEDELFVGRIAGIRDGVGFHASDVATLKASFHEAVDDYLEACAKAGKKPDKPFSGKMMLRVAPDIHAKAAQAAELSGKSLNQWGEEALKTAAEKLVPA